jgi:hypothetical protein
VPTTGWATYADAAGSSPVDGTGGAATVTWTRTTSSPLSGQGSFLFTKGASNLQGQGASYDFTIDAKDKAKVLQINMDYIISSGSFFAPIAAGNFSDLTVWVYDVTNAILIQPSSINFTSSSTTISDKFSATFQTASNSVSYRLIIHVGTTSASAYTLMFDNIQISPSIYVYGSPISGEFSYTPSIGGVGIPTNISFYWRRVGNKIDIRGTFTTGTVTANPLTISLPSGLNIDSSKLSSSGNIFGYLWIANTSANQFKKVPLIATSASTTTLFAGRDEYAVAASYTSAGINGSTVLGSVEPESIKIEGLPIAGWDSSVQMSDSTDTRIVDFVGFASGNALTANVTNIAFTTVKDTHAGWSGIAYTVHVPGDYNVSTFIVGPSTSTMAVYVNSSIYRSIAYVVAGAGGSGSLIIPNLKSGDSISLRSNASQTISSSSDYSLNISRISGPASIAATESVNARYYASATSISGSLATVVWTTKDFDSHNALASGVFTCPTSGKYQVNTGIQVSGTIVLNSALVLEIQKNSTAVTQYQTFAGGAVTAQEGQLSDIISCIAGDTIRVQVSSGATTPIIASSNTKNFISISRVGN